MISYMYLNGILFLLFRDTSGEDHFVNFQQIACMSKYDKGSTLIGLSTSGSIIVNEDLNTILQKIQNIS